MVLRPSDNRSSDPARYQKIRSKLLSDYIIRFYLVSDDASKQTVDLVQGPIVLSRLQLEEQFLVRPVNE